VSASGDRRHPYTRAMTRGTVPERYVTLRLRVGAHVEDFVDAYIGPASLRDAALADGPHDPEALRDEALALLEDATREGLEDDRVAWLIGQLRGIECVAARLAGDDITWSDQVERCFGIRPGHVDEELFRASHERLDEVLPGAGDLSSRYNAWLDSVIVPNQTLPRVLEALSMELRRRTGEIVELPAGERVDYETVTGEPWQAFNDYRGDLASLVQVNLDMPRTIVDVVAIVAHEAYPGHHTERACKEQLLYRDRSRLELSVMISSGPESVITEGIATNALEEVLGDDGFGALLEVVGDLGFPIDPGVAEGILREERWSYEVAANVARMLHEVGITPQEAESYLREWGLDSPERAAKSVEFLMDPGSWAYMTAYTDGRRLCRSFMDRHPDGFRRLLTEQLTVSSLLESDA
jgi:hypothetical protein